MFLFLCKIILFSLSCEENTEVVLLGHSVKGMMSVMLSLLLFLAGQGSKLWKYRGMYEGNMPLLVYSDNRKKRELLPLNDVLCEDTIFHI